MNYIGKIIKESLTEFNIKDEMEFLSKEEEKVTKEHYTPWLDKWTIYTVSIAEENIESVASKLSRLINVSNCNSWYCDFKNYEFHYVIFKDKVFKLDVNKSEDYLKLRDYALSLGLPESQMPNYTDVQNDLISQFLISAKKGTYANASAKKLASSRKGSNDYSYEENLGNVTLTYHDTYFGGTKFIGEEVVYFSSDVPKWGMNYYGVTLDTALSEEAMDKALRPALMKVGEDSNVLPVRGPREFKNDEYKYTFECTGTLDNFSGIEKIYKGEKLIFTLNCNGGFIE